MSGLVAEEQGANTGLHQYILEVDQNDERRTNELVFIDNPVRNGSWLIVWMGICFLLLFVAFNVAQGAVTTIYPNHGFYSLATIYLSLMIGSLIAPSLIPKYLNSPRIIFSGASVVYTFYVLSIYLGPIALLVASALVGLSGACLWLQQGLYVSGVSQRGGGRIGKLTAIFFSIFNVSMIAGNIIPILIQFLGTPENTSPNDLIMVLSIIGGLASFAFLFLPNLPPKKSGILTGHTSGDETTELLVQPVSIFFVCKAFPMKHLAPLSLFHGAFTAFIFGILPLLADPIAKTVTSLIAFMFIAYGIAAALGAFLWGKLFDWRGPRALLLSILVLGTTVIVLLIIIYIAPFDNMLPLVMVVSILSGSLETATATCINTCISIYVKPLMHHQDSATAAGFSIYKIQFCVGFIVLSLVSAFVSHDQLNGYRSIPLVIVAVLLIISVFFGFRMANKLSVRLAGTRRINRTNTIAGIGVMPVYTHDDKEDMVGSNDIIQASMEEVDVTQAGLSCTQLTASKLDPPLTITNPKSKAFAKYIETTVSRMTQKNTAHLVTSSSTKADKIEDREFDLGDRNYS